MLCPMEPEKPLPVYLPPSPPWSEGEEDLYRDPVLDYWYLDTPMTEAELPAPYSPPLAPVPAPIGPRPSPENRPKKGSSWNSERFRSERDRAAAEDRLDSSVSETIRNVLAQSKAATSASAANSTPPSPSRTPGSTPSSSQPTSREASPRLLEPTTKPKRHHDLRRALTPPPPALDGEEDDGPEWNILQDLLLLQAVTKGQEMPYNLLSAHPAHTPNWDFVAQHVNASCPYSNLTPRQCSLRYQLVVLPREDGRLVTFDPITKKPRKIPITMQEMNHVRTGRLKTGQQFEHDGKALIATMVSKRLEALRSAARKRLQPFRPIRPRLPALRSGPLPPRQLAILSRFGVARYEAALNPTELSAIREKRFEERARQQQRHAEQAAAVQAQREQAAHSAALDHAQLARYPAPSHPPSSTLPPAQVQQPLQQPPSSQGSASPSASPQHPPGSQGPNQPPQAVQVQAGPPQRAQARQPVSSSGLLLHPNSTVQSRATASAVVRSVSPATTQSILSSALPPGTRIVAQAPLSIRNAGQAQVRQPSIPSTIRQPRTTPPSTPQPGQAGAQRNLVSSQPLRVPVVGPGRAGQRAQVVPGGAFVVSAESAGTSQRHLVVQSAGATGVSPRMTVARSQLQAAVKKGGGGGLPKIATLAQPRLATISAQGTSGSSNAPRGPIHLVTAYHPASSSPSRVPSQHPPQVHMLRHPIRQSGSEGGAIPPINVLMQVPSGRAGGRAVPVRPPLPQQTEERPPPPPPTTSS